MVEGIAKRLRLKRDGRVLCHLIFTAVGYRRIWRELDQVKRRRKEVGDDRVEN